ncbi:sugar-binding transcriptional regulator [Neorhizobium sp. CSC1952]|uniref:DNA-binding transcriptional regulator LsrR, DeoR family n=1 Tax=Xaviernesmea oryzae TaxID=464029 RepID=A0A1X7EL85_9HYPH|nr:MULTISPECIES: sugar-binding transcriptional regulator [Rhizobium/Agrobacterium group]WJR68688.1 sugar-binding transcriptional regulator [Rhizobium sp. CSC1952]SMF35788.1 DNA-binding transcriptional regulator LsrR, DeoR family [Xaviernesmea oryzae]
MEHRELMVRAAWLYHVEGLTQQQIAERMNVTRRRVNEILSEALETGVVRISFDSVLAESVELEAKLRQRFGLKDAVVVPSPSDPALIHSVLGRGAAGFLGRLIQTQKPASIGVGWGSTLRETIHHMLSLNEPQIKVRSMMGGLTHGSEINTFEIVRGFAQVLNAQCRYFAAPIYAESAESRDAIISQAVFQQTFKQICEVDVAYLSVGDVSQQSLQVRYGLPEGMSEKILQKAGAVGDLMGRYLNAAGKEIDHPLNRQVLSPEMEDFRRIGCRIVASGGAHKHRILHAVAQSGLVNVLITDADSARALLAAR